MYGGFKTQKEFIRYLAERSMTEEEIAQRKAARERKAERKNRRAKLRKLQKEAIEQGRNPETVQIKTYERREKFWERLPLTEQESTAGESARLLQKESGSATEETEGVLLEESEDDIEEA